MLEILCIDSESRKLIKLLIIKNKHPIKKTRFNLSSKIFILVVLKLIISDVNKKITPKEKAEGSKNKPIKNIILPSFKESFKIIFKN